MRFAAALTTFALVLATPLLARADDFAITGNGQTITFSLSASPTPDSFQTGVGFLFNNVNVSDNGTPITIDVGFGNANLGFPDLFLGTGESVSKPGEIDGGDPSYGFFIGSLLYTGTEANPTFIPSTFSIFNLEDPSLGGTPGGTYTLTITAPSSSVTPEPSSFLLLGSGLMGVAGVLRRRLA